ncbi:hypothetical protein P7K49_024108 [Saguinus oedipus]|uniref:ASD1 domain-containing protein n=1 Tax=Saguinus oedipus TaxID=9490 RepID=A0ABQ9UNK8_SAGOE|nr:hypothetical protein P7K49_024108 [Saguinus oedipus]
MRFSESAEALGNGEQHFKNKEPKLEKASRVPWGQQLSRGAADGSRGPQRPAARLLRSQSTFQLSREPEMEAEWLDRPALPAGPRLRSCEALASASLHTPRERHSVTLAEGDLARPAPPAARRGNRRRLTPDQKKRSNSEP